MEREREEKKRLGNMKCEKMRVQQEQLKQMSGQLIIDIIQINAHVRASLQKVHLAR